MRAYLLVLVAAAMLTFVTTPVVRRIAERFRAMTPVRDRDVHSVPRPRLGGLAMLVGLGCSMLMASHLPFFGPVFDKPGVWGVMLAATLMCLLGAADDLWGVDPFTRLGGQCLAGGILAWNQVQLVTLPIDGLTVGSSGLFLVLTVLSVVITINAVNFIDGLDGLAAGVVAIAAAAFFIYTYMLTRHQTSDNYSSLAALVAAGLVGCCLGFLPHNFNPARIFMGDSGSYLLGLLLAAATISVTGQVDPQLVSNKRLVPAFAPILLPVAVLVIPMLDFLWAVFRRVLAGKSPVAADRGHLHHRLLDLGHTHVRAVLILYMWTAVIAFGAISVAFMPWQVAAVVVGIAAVLALAWTLKAERPAG